MCHFVPRARVERKCFAASKVKRFRLFHVAVLCGGLSSVLSARLSRTQLAKIKHVRSADHKSHFLIELTSEQARAAFVAAADGFKPLEHGTLSCDASQMQRCLISVCSHVAPRGMLSTSAKLSTLPAQH